MSKFPRRGDVYWVSLDPTIGSEIKKTRPCLVVSNDVGNEVASRIIIAPITSSQKKLFPFEVLIYINEKMGKVLLDQIRAIDKMRLKQRICTVDNDIMHQVDDALKKVLAIK